MADAPLLIIAAGGTGGHMFPAQSLAEEMLARGWRVKLSTDPRGARYTGGFPDEIEIDVVDSATFARGGIKAKLMVPLRIAKGVITATFGMREDRPKVVAGFGGYPAIPAMAAAGFLKIPRIIHEQNGVLGRVNKRFARAVNYVACSVWPTVLPQGANGLHVGNPVRSSVMTHAGADYIPPGDWPLSFLVIGGSQGARILAETVPEAIALLPAGFAKDIRVAQQAREEDMADCQATYDRLGITAEVSSFFDDVPRRMSEAQLVISRAGASSVADISVIGRPSILIPLPSAMDDHQTANARGLSQADAAILLPEKELSPEVLADCIQRVLASPEGASLMAKAALSQGKPEASKSLADLVASLAH